MCGNVWKRSKPLSDFYWKTHGDETFIFSLFSFLLLSTYSGRHTWLLNKIPAKKETSKCVVETLCPGSTPLWEAVSSKCCWVDSQLKCFWARSSYSYVNTVSKERFSFNIIILIKTYIYGHLNTPWKKKNYVLKLFVILFLTHAYSGTRKMDKKHPQNVFFHPYISAKRITYYEVGDTTLGFHFE